MTSRAATSSSADHAAVKTGRPPLLHRGPSTTAVQLRRVDEARRMRRFYPLTIQPGRFGGSDLVQKFGQIGSPGRVLKLKLNGTVNLIGSGCDKAYEGRS